MSFIWTWFLSTNYYINKPYNNFFKQAAHMVFLILSIETLKITVYVQIKHVLRTKQP